MNFALTRQSTHPGVETTAQPQQPPTGRQLRKQLGKIGLWDGEVGGGSLRLFGREDEGAPLGEPAQELDAESLAISFSLDILRVVNHKNSVLHKYACSELSQ